MENFFAFNLCVLCKYTTQIESNLMKTMPLKLLHARCHLAIYFAEFGKKLRRMF